jgi:hypothetical protein
MRDILIAILIVLGSISCSQNDNEITDIYPNIFESFRIGTGSQSETVQGFIYSDLASGGMMDGFYYLNYNEFELVLCEDYGGVVIYRCSISKIEVDYELFKAKILNSYFK